MRIVVVAAIMMTACLAFGEESPVVNPGFDASGDGGLPISWSGVADVYQRDGSVLRTGQGALRFVNSDPNRYVLCAQPITLAPGRMYDYGVWVKTQGIAGSDSGATICLEWTGTDGKYLGGAYAAGIKGDNDWTYVHARSGRIPKEAAHIVVACYVRQGMTGTAWWDDVQITLARQEPLSSVLAQPNYRGQLADDGPRWAVVRTVTDLVDYDLRFEDVALKWTIVQGQETLGEGQAAVAANGKTDVRIPVRRLPCGDYEARVTLVKKSDHTTLGTATHRFTRVASLSKRAAYVDAHNRLIVDGQPFFPLGMYWGTIEEKELNVYADSPLNCLMPYQGPDKAQMDLCQSKGLKVIYTVKDIYSGESCCPANIKTEDEEIAYVKGKAETFRDHPALLAWYINDELGTELLPRLAARRRLMEALDPGHPTWVVLYQVDLIDQYLDTFDTIGTDPYPLPARSAAMAGEWTRKTVDGVQGARPVWQVPQVFNWACYRTSEEEKAACRPPTFDEMRSMTWQCIANGARGIVYYSWFDIHRDPTRPFDVQWALVKQTAQEVADYIPALLSVEKTPAIGGDEGGGAAWTVRQLAGKTFLIVVNPKTEPLSPVFRLHRTPTTTFVKGIPLKPAGHTLRVDLKPLDVKIVEMTGLV